jgi:hypothetical protein
MGHRRRNPPSKTTMLAMRIGVGLAIVLAVAATFARGCSGRNQSVPYVR